MLGDTGAATLRPVRGQRLRALLGAYRYPLGVGLASRVVVLALFVAIAGGVDSAESLPDAVLRLLGSWDGVWYRRIATFGYDPGLAHGNSPAFFPLWPALLRGASALFPGVPLTLVGSLLAQLLFLAALCVVHRLVADRLGEPAARRTTFAIAFFPTAHVFSAVYTESLFLLLTASAFLLAHRGRYGAAAAVGALAALTRPTGVLLAPALALQALADDGFRLRRRGILRMLPLALVPAAFLAFQAYLAWRTGLGDATRLAQERGWGRGFTPLLVLQMPVAGLDAVWDALHDRTSAATVAVAFAASLWSWLLVWGAIGRRVPASWWAFAVGVVVLPAAAGTYTAFIRYGMAAFPLMALLGLAARRRVVQGALLALLPLALAAAMAWTYGVGELTP